MGRPAKDIKHKLDRASGRYMVAYAEAPDSYHMTPEADLAKALSWAKRNKNKILAAPEKPIFIRDLAEGFFDADGEWYQDQVAKGRSMTAASLSIRQAHIVNYIIPLLGDEDARTLRGADIDRIVLDAERFTARKGEKTETALKPLSRGTRSKLLYSIKLMYDRWIYLGIVRENPTNSIVKYSKDPERPRSTLPREVVAKLFPPTHGDLVRVWGSSMWGALMLVLWDTGARPGEARALKWKDYYPKERFVPIRHGVEAGTKDKLKGTKNDRIKPGLLQIRTAQELDIWRSESRYAKDSDFIFTVTGITPLTDAAIGQAFGRALNRLGYDSTGWTPYWLRHTFVTEKMSILTDEEVSVLAGHSVQVDRSIYQHADDQTIYKRAKSLKEKLDRKDNSHIES